MGKKQQGSKPQRRFPRPWRLISSQKCCVSREAGTEEPRDSPSPIPSTASLQILSLISSKATLGVGSLPLTTRDKCTSLFLVPSPKVPGKGSHGLCLGAYCLHTCETVNLYRLSHSVCGICSVRPSRQMHYVLANRLKPFSDLQSLNAHSSHGVT